MTPSAPALLRLKLLALAVGLLLSTGCHRIPPLDEKISARSPLDLAIWRSQVGSDLTPEQWAVFDAASQEIKFRLTAEHLATGAEAVDETFRATIDGQSVRQISAIGCRLKLNRFEEDRVQLQKFLAANARLRTRPDDEASINYLRDLHDRQEARLKSIVDEITRLNAWLHEIEPAAAAPR